MVCVRDGMHADVDVDTVPRACMQAKAFTHIHAYSVRLYAPTSSSRARFRLPAALHTHTTHTHTHTLCFYWCVSVRAHTSDPYSSHCRSRPSAPPLTPSLAGALLPPTFKRFAASWVTADAVAAADCMPWWIVPDTW